MKRNRVVAVVSVLMSVAACGGRSAFLDVDAAPQSGADSGPTGPTSDASSDGTVTDRTAPDAQPGDDGGGGDSGGGNLSFAADVYPIITASCVVCHVPSYPGGAAGALDMGGGASATLTLLVNRPPAGVAAGVNAGACATAGLASSIKLVVPRDSGNSLLYNKVASAEIGGPTVLCGVPMPQGSSLAPSSLVTTIKSWIDDGAKP